MSTKEKQATPKAAFDFLVPLANEQPAKQAGKRVSAGSGADESTEEKQATPKAAFVFHVPLANGSLRSRRESAPARARERTRARKKNKRRRKESDQTDRVYK